MNKRIRKKKRLAEFQEMGFEIQIEYPEDKDAWPDEDWEELCNFLDKNKFVYGGGPGGLFITKCGCNPNNKRKVCRGSISKEEYQMVADWLEAKYGNKAKTGKLQDAWY